MKYVRVKFSRSKLFGDTAEKNQKSVEKYAKMSQER
jgi:hypothetical protein